MKLRPLSKLYFSVVCLAYVMNSLLIPPNKKVLVQYHISSTSARLLSASILIPVILIWIAAFYGASKLYLYSKKIVHGSDGIKTMYIARGLFMLALGLPTVGLINALYADGVNSHPQLLSSSVVVADYITLIVPLFAFLFIGYGSRSLVEQIKVKTSHVTTYFIVLISSMLSVIYTYLVFKSGSYKSIYHLRALPLLLTIIIPYVFMWFIGILAVTDSYIYSLKVRGVIYRSAWRRLSMGIGLVVFGYIALQYLTTLSNKLTKLKLGPLVLLIYVFLLGIASGYIIIATATKKLQKIEEI